MSPNASHRVRPGLSSAASLITTLLISFDHEGLNQHLNLVTPEYPFFESLWVTFPAACGVSPMDEHLQTAIPRRLRRGSFIGTAADNAPEVLKAIRRRGLKAP